MKHTRDFDRDGCIVGARFVSYHRLESWFVCRDCGGGLVHYLGRIDGHNVDWAECEDCGSRDFISLAFYERQLLDAPRIIEGLPPFLRALFPGPEPLGITADQAIAELFDL